MIVVDNSGNVYIMDEADRPRVVVGGDSNKKQSLLDCAKRIKDYCAVTECEDCIFELDDERFPCKVSGGMPDGWGV